MMKLKSQLQEVENLGGFISRLMVGKEKSRVDSRDALSTKGGGKHFGWHCPWHRALLGILANVYSAS